jgi:hypothetical protein
VEIGRDNLVFIYFYLFFYFIYLFMYFFFFFFLVSLTGLLFSTMSKEHADKLDGARMKYAEAFLELGEGDGSESKFDHELKKELAFQVAQNGVSVDFESLGDWFRSLQNVLGGLFHYYPRYSKPKVSTLLTLALADNDRSRFQRELMESTGLPMRELESLAYRMLRKGKLISDSKNSGGGVRRSYRPCTDIRDVPVGQMALLPLLYADIATDQLQVFQSTPVEQRIETLCDAPKRVVFCILNPENLVPCRILLNSLRYSREFEFELQFVTALHSDKLFCVGEENDDWMKEIIRLMLFPLKSCVSGKIAVQKAQDAALTFFVFSETADQLGSANLVLPRGAKQYGVICGSDGKFEGGTVEGYELIDMRPKQ